MEPEGSLPHSQVPATCPYPEPARSSPTPTSHFLKIHLNIILPSTRGSSKWSHSLRFPHQKPVHALTFPHTRYMPRPSHSSRFNDPNNIWWQYRSLSFTLRSFLHSPVFLVPLRPNYCTQYPILKWHLPTFLPQCKWPSFTPVQNRKNYSSVYPNLQNFG